MPFVIVILSAAIGLVSGLCAMTLFPDMTRMQVVTWGIVTFGLLCIPSLAAVFAQRSSDKKDETDIE